MIHLPRSYFSHISELGACTAPNCYFDLRDNDDIVADRSFQHTTYVLNDAIQTTIQEHDTSLPMFLYYPVIPLALPQFLPSLSVIPIIASSRKLFSRLIS